MYYDFHARISDDPSLTADDIEHLGQRFKLVDAEGTEVANVISYNTDNGTLHCWWPNVGDEQQMRTIAGLKLVRRGNIVPLVGCTIPDRHPLDEVTE